jgi:peptide/nickel transport system substrate-binding protein
LWHDGKPVTAEDCVASIKRWGAKDTMGQKLMTFVKTCRSSTPGRSGSSCLRRPGWCSRPGQAVVEHALHDAKRVAETSPSEQISDTTGSGPFVFKRDEWKPGDKAVSSSSTSTSRAPSRFEPAGGKVVKVDRVEWKSSPTSRPR